MDRKAEFACPDCGGRVVRRRDVMGSGDAAVSALFGPIAFVWCAVFRVLDPRGGRLVCRDCERRWMKKFTRGADGATRCELVGYRRFRAGER